jgi:hypothetical protein
MKKERILGKRTGCDITDGAYHIAPMYIDSFHALQERREGVNRLIASVTDHCVDLNIAIAKAERMLWKQVEEDLGLDPKKQWQYQHGVVTEVKPNPDVKGGR